METEVFQKKNGTTTPRRYKGVISTSQTRKEGGGQKGRNGQAVTGTNTGEVPVQSQ